MIKRWCVALMVLLMAGAVRAEQTAQAFERQITITVRTKYLLSLPEKYGQDKQQRWPLLLFLHGAGERGDDLEMVKKHGPPKLAANGKQFPFIVVSPQCPWQQWWSPEVLNALLDEITEKYAVDKGRIYLTGLSMGGFGTWSLAAAHPERFAAIAPICGGGDPKLADRLKNIPTWVFHGALDKTVPLQKSQDMVAAIKAAGGNPKLTVYDDADHDSWTRTYDDPKFYEWLLAQRKPAKP